MKVMINRNLLIKIQKEFTKKNKKKISPNSNIIREYKKTLYGLSSNQRESAIEHLLGDARIEQSKNKKNV